MQSNGVVGSRLRVMLFALWTWSRNSRSQVSPRPVSRFHPSTDTSFCQCEIARFWPRSTLRLLGSSTECLCGPQGYSTNPTPCGVWYCAQHRAQRCSYSQPPSYRFHHAEAGWRRQVIPTLNCRFALYVLRQDPFSDWDS